MTTLASCTSTRVAITHSELREVLLDYTEDQILDNLIRAKNHHPILHFDVSKVSAAITTDVSGDFTGITAGTRPFGIKATPKMTDALTVDVDPQTSINKIYQMYNLFAPELKCADKPPLESDEHVGKRWKKDGRYYWVPAYLSEEYYVMAMGVAVLRETTEEGEKNATASLQNDPVVRSARKKSNLGRELSDILDIPIRPSESSESDASRAIKDLENEFRLQRIQ